MSPLTGVYENTALVSLIALIPFTFHWYSGVDPPFTGTAVNVTGVPAQTVFAAEDIVTLTGCTGLTIMIMVLEVTGLLVVQVRLDVIWT